MNTMIIEHADNKVTDAIKQLMEVLGLPVKIAPEEGWVPVESVVTNPEILRRIEEYESGKTKGKGLVFKNADELKAAVEKMIVTNA